MKVKVNATPAIDGLSGQYQFADNKLQDAFRITGFVRLLAAHRIGKRSGPPVVRVMYGILIRPILGVGTVACFCGEFLGCFIHGCKDVVYDFLKRENINWRGLSMGVGRNVFGNGIPGDPEQSAFVVDDTNKHRRGSASRKRGPCCCVPIRSIA